jgi:hypothetical protein
MPSFLFVCPRKVRVMAELAQLVPDHVLGHEHVVEDAPLCTLKVCPTNSGTIVQRRAQVLIGSRLRVC